MEYIDARIRMPVTKLGQFILDLPHWAQMLGIDRLENNAPVQRTRRTRVPNGEYTPEPGSVVEKVYKHLSAEAMRPGEVYKALKQHKKQAVSSAIGNLTRRGLVIKQKDGTYVGKK